MFRRLALALLASTVLSGFGATAAISADGEFADFPDVPQSTRIDDAFRDAGGYIGARLGAIWADDTAFAITGPSTVANAYDLGIAGSFMLGFEVPDLYLGLGVRLEAELGYSEFDVDTHTVGGTRIAASDSFGSTNAFSAMVNAYVDYGMGKFRPFIGGGIGVARLDFQNHGVTGSLGVMDDTDNGFAWQAMGGLGYDVTNALTLEAMVRYQDVSGVALRSSTGPTTKVDLSSTQVLLGARVSF